MSRRGRELERLVSILEGGFPSSDVVIKSPDHIEDKITGNKREVDVSIRGKMGSHNILIVLECHDHKYRDDVTWIEQLQTKTEDLNANKVIAVSSSGFSEPAETKAKHYGIEVRTIDEISNEDLDNWVIPSAFVIHCDKHHIIGCTIRSNNPLFDSTKIPFDVNSKNFKIKDTLLSANDFFNLIPSVRKIPFPEKEGIENKRTEKFTFDLRANNAKVETEFGWLKIDGIELTVELWRAEEGVLPATKMLSYSNEKERLAGASIFPSTFISDGKEFNLVTHTYKDRDKQTIKFTLTPKKEDK